MNRLSAGQIARVVHEANKGYCESIGDYSQVTWEKAPEWQRESAIKGVQAVLDGTARTPEEQHQSWLDEKVRTGWQFGAIKNAETKRHPCMVPYDALPPEQKMKDHLFRAIVTTLIHGLN